MSRMTGADNGHTSMRKRATPPFNSPSSSTTSLTSSNREAELEAVRLQLQAKQRDLEERERRLLLNASARRQLLQYEEGIEETDAELLALEDEQELFELCYYSQPVSTVSSPARKKNNQALLNLRGLLIPRDVKRKKDLVLDELRLVTQNRCHHLEEIEDIRSLERRLQEIRLTELQQSQEIHKKLAGFGGIGTCSAPSLASFHPRTNLFDPMDPILHMGGSSQHVQLAAQHHYDQQILYHHHQHLQQQYHQQTSEPIKILDQRYLRRCKQLDRSRRYVVRDDFQRNPYQTLPSSRLIDAELQRKKLRILHLEKEIEKRKRQIQETLLSHDILAIDKVNSILQNETQHLAPLAHLNTWHFLDEVYSSGEYLAHRMQSQQQEALHTTYHPSYQQQQQQQQPYSLADEFVLPFYGLSNANVAVDSGFSRASVSALCTTVNTQQFSHPVMSNQIQVAPPLQLYRQQKDMRFVSEASSPRHVFSLPGSEFDSPISVAAPQIQQSLHTSTTPSSRIEFVKRIENPSDLQSQNLHRYSQENLIAFPTHQYSNQLPTYFQQQHQPQPQHQQHQQQKSSNLSHSLKNTNYCSSKSQPNPNKYFSNPSFAENTDAKQQFHYKTMDSVKKYDFPVKRLLIARDPRVRHTEGCGIGMFVHGGVQCADGHLGAFVKEVVPGSIADRLHGEIKEGDEIIEWNGVCLIGCTYDEVSNILRNSNDEIEVLVRLSCPPDLLKNTAQSEKNINTSYQVDNHKQAQHHTTKKCELQYQPAPQVQRQSLSRSDLTDDELGVYFDSYQATPVTFSDTQLHHIPHVVWQQAHEFAESNESIPYLGKGSPPKPSSPTDNMDDIVEYEDNNLSLGARLRRDQYYQRKNESVCNNVNLLEPRQKLLFRGESGSQTTDSSIDKQRTVSEDDSDRRLDGSDVSQPKQQQAQQKSNSLLGDICLQISFDDYDSSLTVHVAKARGLQPMDLNGLADPFCKLRLYPDPDEDPENFRQIKYMSKTLQPEWQQTVVFMNVPKKELRHRILECTVWDFDRLKTNDFMGQMTVRLSGKVLDNEPYWYPLHELRPVKLSKRRSCTKTSSNDATDGYLECNSVDGEDLEKYDRYAGGRGHVLRDISRVDASGYNLVPVDDDKRQQRNTSMHYKVNSSCTPYCNDENERERAKMALLSENQQESNNESKNKQLVGARFANFGDQLLRVDTFESRSSNCSSMVVDFLTEEQRDQVRQWLGPGQLFLVNPSCRSEDIDGLPNDAIVAAELHLVLRKVQQDHRLEVTVNQARHIKCLSKFSEVYVKLCLLFGEYSLSRVTKKKTKTQCVKDCANFSEKFVFNTALDHLLLQVTLWLNGKRLNSKKLLGEAIIHLEDIEYLTNSSQTTICGWYKLLLPDILPS